MVATCAALANPDIYTFLEQERYLYAIRHPANRVLQREPFPRVGFIVTNLRRDAAGVVRFYNGRGVAEQWDKLIKSRANRLTIGFPASGGALGDSPGGGLVQDTARSAVVWPPIPGLELEERAKWQISVNRIPWQSNNGQ